MDIIGTMRIAAGLIFLLFIPGFVLSWVFYPKKDSVAFIERLAYSFVLSIASTVLAVLFLDMGLGIDTSPRNIVLVILCLICLSAILWRLELIILDYLEKQKTNRISVSQTALNLKLSEIRQKITNQYQDIVKKIKKRRSEDH